MIIIIVCNHIEKKFLTLVAVFPIIVIIETTEQTFTREAVLEEETEKAALAKAARTTINWYILHWNNP
jgi:hypothetical protein